VRRLVPLESLQWYALFGAGLAWTAQLVLGFYVGVARCGAGGDFGLAFHTWQATLMAVAGAFALAGEAAAAAVFLMLKEVEHDGPPPDGRRQFFAAGALVGNLLFLMVIVLSGIGYLAHSPCHQA